VALEHCCLSVNAIPEDYGHRRSHRRRQSRKWLLPSKSSRKQSIGAEVSEAVRQIAFENGYYGSAR